MNSFLGLTTLCIIACFLSNLAEAKIIGAYALPHGGIAIDPYYFPAPNASSRAQAVKLYEALKQASNEIAQLNPDLIFLSTPHAIAHERDFLIYQNTQGEGNAGTEGNYEDFKLHLNLGADVAASMVSYLKSNGQNVSAVTAFASGEEAPLRWGEVIPLYYIPHVEGIYTVILTQPTRRLLYNPDFIPELLTVGSYIYNFLDGLSQKVVVIISGDLAHTHDPNGPYGWSPDAEPYDQAMGNWAKTLNSDYLLNPQTGATAYVAKALSCGYTGYIMFQGIVNGAGSKIKWKPQLYANFHPSYYGMFIASFM